MGEGKHHGVGVGGGVGPGAVAGSGSVTAETIAGRDVHYHAPDEMSNPRLRAVFQELAALDANGGVHLKDYFDLKHRYPELSAEIDAAMLVQLVQQQRRLEQRLDRVEQAVQRIRRDVLLLFSSPVLAAAALLIILVAAG
jgi:hypothetical protein